MKLTQIIPYLRILFVSHSGHILCTSTNHLMLRKDIIADYFDIRSMNKNTKHVTLKHIAEAVLQGVRL
jgi:hypothetical protein